MRALPVPTAAEEALWEPALGSGLVAQPVSVADNPHASCLYIYLRKPENVRAQKGEPLW